MSTLNTLINKSGYFEARTTTEQRQVLALLGKEAFSFAETVYKELKDPDKLAEAVKYLEQKAAVVGIKVTFEEARAVVEAAWLEDKRKELPVIEVGTIESVDTAAAPAAN
ncbi:hypothetical protein Psfp_03326 [Pelotomaculum sp. FP]|uniref:phage holin, LLH family n=1 Tax=Pelotomaculum sp. FP TaxID=261474 RepID=UPI001066D2B6|nr:phage holin, LLH family [Pelotomaculum sp. FP]TEB13910.1 hypothetical protein Psfp_03326 [Pelotomaculum sp. FP]